MLADRTRTISNLVLLASLLLPACSESASQDRRTDPATADRTVDADLLANKASESEPAERHLSSAQAIGLARECFKNYIIAEKTFDKSIADFYSDSARIVNKRYLADGSHEMLTMPAEKYKDNFRDSRLLASMRANVHGYSNVSFQKEAERVRINAQRYNMQTRFTGEYQQLIGVKANERCIIFEEYQESRKAEARH